VKTKIMAYAKASQSKKTSSADNNNTSLIDVRSLKAAINPAEFYQSRSGTMPQTARTGWVEGGLCPFHLDNKLGSYRVNTETGAFKCFSCGVSGGDVIAHEMEKENISFQDALQNLAGEYDISGKTYKGTKRPFSARDALLTLTKEASIITLAASDIVNGREITASDLDRITQAWNRLQTACLEVTGV